MKNSGKLLVIAIVLLVLGLLGIAITPLFFSRNQTNDKSFSSLGEQIYLTGIGENGRQISFSGGLQWMNMNGESCASCHGEDDKGGIRIEMTNEKAPDIKLSTLSKGDHEHEEEKSNHKDEHESYDEKSIKRAITKGLNPDGKELDSVMPRWKMNDTELELLVKYLKTL